MPIIYIDADACPVKDEAYRVAARYGVPVVVVANNPMRVPEGVQLVTRTGFGAADDFIAEAIETGDICVTADIPLAARCLAKSAKVLDVRGEPMTENDIGAALAVREINEERRQYGERAGGPPPMTPRDRSRFLATLDEMVNAALRGR